MLDPHMKYMKINLSVVSVFYNSYRLDTRGMRSPYGSLYANRLHFFRRWAEECFAFIIPRDSGDISLSTHLDALGTHGPSIMPPAATRHGAARPQSRPGNLHLLQVSNIVGSVFQEAPRRKHHRARVTRR